MTLATLALALVGSACTAATATSTAAHDHSSGRGRPPGHGVATTVAPTTTSTTMPPTTTTSEPPGWTAVAGVAGAPAIDEQGYTGPDGQPVAVFRFRAGRVRFDLHDGSGDPPPGSATIGPDSGPTIGPDETASLLAAFNGGFESSTGAGGMEIDGQVLVPLAPGLASFVVDTDGSGHIGVWGQTVPGPGEQVASVRQNLQPLVLNGQPSPEIDDISAWGATLGGGSSVARSALGEDAQGNILYAGSMSALPLDMAQALINAGAQQAMELDINPEWVQLAYAPTQGAPLVAGVPGQNRPADQYMEGWTRDFVAVLAAAS